MRRVYFKGSRADVRRVALRMKGILSGAESDPRGVARGFLLALGFGALSDIKEAFVVKARGGTDEMGVKWPRLSPKYLAYGRRFGSKEKAGLKKAASVGRGHNLAPGGKEGMLSAAQLKRWRQIYSQMLRRLMVSMPEGAAKGRAAAIAWTVLKREGAKTKLEVYGNRQDVEILRDTGVLFNSLSPGVLGGSGAALTYTRPAGEGGDQQVFDVGAGSIVVGTNVPYAGAHDNPTRPKMPRRQILPENEAQIPDRWWSNWFNIARDALEAGAEILFRDAA